MEPIKIFFKENYAKLRDLYLSMTLGNRIVASLLMITLLVSLGYLIVGGIKPADPRSKTVYMYDGYEFNSNERGAAEYAFSQRGLVDHQWNGQLLQVPTSRRHAYALALAEANVIDKKGLARLSQANDLTPWVNARMMDTKMIAAKEIDTADAIKKIPGIADVTILTHKRPEWDRNVWARKHVFSVSVSVKAIENKPLSDATVGAIGRLVATAFGITDIKEISIIDTQHQRAYDGSGEELSSAQGEYLRHQTKFQEDWNETIRQHLPPIEGLDVKTDVTVTTYRSQRAFTVEHDRPTPLVTHELDYHFHKEGWDRFFRPGQIAQWSRPLIDPTGDTSPKDTTDEKKREQEITHALPGREIHEERLPYIPLRVRASIRIPREHILAIWRAKNRLLGELDAVPTAEQLQAEEESFRNDIKESIGNLLAEYRPSAKVDPKELVTVTYFDPIREEVPELTAWQQFLLFLRDHWQTLGLMSMVFSGLLVLWLISKPQKPEDIVIYEGLETPLEAIDARLEEKRRLEEEARRLAEEAAAAAAAEQEEFENSLGELGSLRSLRDEIAELIAKNPEAAAAVIRQWIGNAALVEAKA